MKTVYADIVIIENFLIDYVLLSLSARSMNICVKQIRLIISALLSGVYALAIIVLKTNDSIKLLLNFLVLLITCMIVLGKRSAKVYIRFYITMYVFSFLLFGSLSIVPEGNAYVTAVLMILVFAVFSVVATKIPEWFVMRCNASTVSSQIVFDSKMFELTFVCDSGNLLTDPCTKLPVVIVGRNFPGKIDINKVKMRQIQYKTISGIGVMSVISPKEIRVFVHGKWQKVNAVIGINENIGEAMAGADGIIPTRLIENL